MAAPVHWTLVLWTDDAQHARAASSALPSDIDVHVVDSQAALWRLLEDCTASIALIDRSGGSDAATAAIVLATLERFPEAEVAVVLAQPWVDLAVAAVRNGALDVLQRPWTGADLARLIAVATERRAHALASDGDAGEHAAHDARALERARTHLRRHELDDAERVLRRVAAHLGELPALFNLLGAVRELRGQRFVAQTFYRAALQFDPTYSPAHHNLARNTRGPMVEGAPDLGPPERG